MVDFNSEFEEYPEQEPQTIEKHVSDTDVGLSALRIAADRHEASHNDGKHKVVVRDEKEDRFSEQEEQVIDKLKQSEDAEYKRAVINEATGLADSYGGGSSDDSYGHGGGHGQASCTCGWNVDDSQAVQQMIGTAEGENKTGVSYTSDADAANAGPGSYSSNQSLEDATQQYSSGGATYQ
jgi:hypothetical protein